MTRYQASALFLHLLSTNGRFSLNCQGRTPNSLWQWVTAHLWCHTSARDLECMQCAHAQVLLDVWPAELPGSLPGVSSEHCLAARQREQTRQRHIGTRSYPCIGFPTQERPISRRWQPEAGLQRDCDRAVEVGALGPGIRREKSQPHEKAKSIYLQHLTTSRPLVYVYMYMCMDCVSSTPFSQNRSTVVEFKCITSKCLVQFLYMCMGCFFPVNLLCFVL